MKKTEKQYRAEYYRANKERIAAQHATYREANKEKIKALTLAWRAANKEKLAEYYARTRKKRLAYKVAYRAANKDKIAAYKAATKERDAEYRKKYRAENKDKVAAYRAKNKKRISAVTLAYGNEWRKKRMAADPAFKIRIALRIRGIHALKRQRTAKTFQSHIKFLGCTVEQARKHLESQFEPWMTWENHGFRGWHIDHIKPLASFDLSDPEQVKKAFHYTNLRPLHWQDNIKNGSRLGGETTKRRGSKVTTAKKDN